MTYRFAVRGQAYEAPTVEECSALYAAARDASNEGASTWPEAYLNVDGHRVGRLSYNARVWCVYDRERCIYDPSKPVFEPNPRQRVLVEGRKATVVKPITNYGVKGYWVVRFDEGGSLSVPVSQMKAARA